MASLGTLVRVEFAKLIRRPMTWILAVILLGFVVLVYASLGLALLSGFEGNVAVEGAEGESLRDIILLPEGFGLGMGLAQGVGGILLAILSAGTFGSEFSWGTIRTLLLMRADRTRIVVAKLLVLMVAVLAVAIIGVAVGFVGSLAVGLALGESARTSEWLNAAFFGDVAKMSAVVIVGLAFWVIVAASITVVTHSLAAGIGLTIASIFVGDFAGSLIQQVGRVGVWVSRLFPNTALNTLNQLTTPSAPSLDASDWAWITANLVGYTVLALAVAIIRFRHMNVLAVSGT